MSTSIAAVIFGFWTLLEVFSNIKIAPLWKGFFFTPLLEFQNCVGVWSFLSSYLWGQPLNGLLKHVVSQFFQGVKNFLSPRVIFVQEKWQEHFCNVISRFWELRLLKSQKNYTRSARESKFLCEKIQYYWKLCQTKFVFTKASWAIKILIFLVKITLSFLLVKQLFYALWVVLEGCEHMFEKWWE